MHFYVCVSSGIEMHNKMFRAILRAPIRFFDTNSSGKNSSVREIDVSLVDGLGNDNKSDNNDNYHYNRLINIKGLSNICNSVLIINLDLHLILHLFFRPDLESIF